jgi:TolB-like protein/Flp pilus assembly protein TadD
MPGCLKLLANTEPLFIVGARPTDPLGMFPIGATMLESTSKAVFLSHASQDSDAAKRISDALRAHGVEVWFDADGGLEHGDEWDAKIRRQIKECLLFLPIISSATQARHEGYFRIEWDLAAERARGIASGVPFILPIVIDETREPDALVPDRFRSVQWMRLPGGIVSADVLRRFLKLWSHRAGVIAHEAAKAPAPAEHAPYPAAPATTGSGLRRYAAIGLVAALIAGAVAWGLWGRGKPPAAAAAPAAPDQKSVAILPFENLSDDKENEYFSDGISEELLDVLTKVPGLRVAARTSSFYFKGRNATAQEIGAKLGVANLVDGSVRRAGTSVRISARLSRAATGEEIWSQSYTRDLKDVFAVQTELAQTIVEQLGSRLGGQEAKAEILAEVQAAEKGGTRNAEAHQLYLQGKFYTNRIDIDMIEKGAALLQRAVELDSHYALAWAALSKAGGKISGYAVTPDEVTRGLQLARSAAERALALEPELPDALVAKADVQTAEYDWKGAWGTLAHAAELAPNDSAVLAEDAELQFTLGNMDRADALSTRAALLDPVNSEIALYRGFSLVVQHRYNEAEAVFHTMIELMPDSVWGHAGLALTGRLQGHFEEALKEAVLPKAEWIRDYQKAEVLWALGRKAESDAALKMLIDGFAGVAAYQVAEVYSSRNDNDAAFQWLERAFRQQDSGLLWIHSDVDMANLRTDPRYQVFLAKMGLADEQLAWAKHAP